MAAVGFDALVDILAQNIEFSGIVGALRTEPAIHPFDEVLDGTRWTAEQCKLAESVGDGGKDGK